MKRLRICAISYLNTAPLMWDFEHGDEDTRGAFDISYTLPSQCAADLAAGVTDIGIIPVAAYASVPGLIILPGSPLHRAVQFAPSFWSARSRWIGFVPLPSILRPLPRWR